MLFRNRVIFFIFPLRPNDAVILKVACYLIVVIR